MALALRNQFGQIDLSVIDPLAVAEISDTAQERLAALIVANDARVAARERHNAAVRAVKAAEEEQAAAIAAHREASDPFPFKAPDVANYGTKAAYDAALQEARAQHDTRVRAYRANEARKAAIAAYNSSH
jgi:hypothetical protein